MSVEIAELDLGDGAVLDRLVELQRASYAVEARLIGAAGLPPMRETPQQLRSCGETFLGATRAGALVGAVSYKLDAGTVDIHRLVVDPGAFRGGVATALLDALEAREAAAEHWTVGTGAANAPARALYERRGYAVTEDRVVPGGVRWVRLDRPGAARPVALLALGCLALAALSLLGPTSPTYDPWAWIIWGREVTHLDLVTIDGPSWKPLPVLFTAPFSLLGDGTAPELWILVARTGGLLALAMAYRLGARLAGPAAGVIAALALALADEFVRNFARGNSEGMLVAFCLLALERHLDGRRRDAFLLGFLAGLLRPELWPLWGLYGLWLVAAAWHGGPPWRAIALVGGSGLLTLVVWFVPEYLGSGSLLRAAERALQPNPDSAAFASSPFVEVFRRSATILSVPVYAGAAIAVVLAARRRREHFAAVVATLSVLSTALMVAVALMTEGGFAGNLRYVALPAAMVCVLAGAGWVGLYRLVRRRSGGTPAAVLAAVALAGAAPLLVVDAGQFRTSVGRLGPEADLYGANLKAMIAKAGGERALKACGPVYTGAFQTQAVAWYLHLHETDVSIFPMPPGTIVAPHYTAHARDPRFPVVTKTSRWMVGSSCNTP